MVYQNKNYNLSGSLIDLIKKKIAENKRLIEVYAPVAKPLIDDPDLVIKAIKAIAPVTTPVIEKPPPVELLVVHAPVLLPAADLEPEPLPERIVLPVPGPQKEKPFIEKYWPVIVTGALAAIAVPGMLAG